MRSNDPTEVLKHLADADYLVDENEFGATDEVEPLLSIVERVRKAGQRLDLAFAGARVAQVFLQRPWLQGFTLSVSQSQEYNDAGGTYTSYSLNCSNVTFVTGQELPEEIQDDSVEVSADIAAEQIKDDLQNEEFDLCHPFLQDSDDADRDLVIDRASIAELLAKPPVSGQAVARRLWADDFKGLGA